MLGTDPGVVESGGDRVDGRRLPVRVLQNVTECPMQDPRFAAAQRRGVFALERPAAAGLDPD